MRHFRTLTNSAVESLFMVPPGDFDVSLCRETLAVGLGAMLYMRGTQPDLASVLTKQRRAGVTSVAVCLEDSIGPEEVEAADINLRLALRLLGEGEHSKTPLLFCRVREPSQIADLCHSDVSNRIVGFVIPKFSNVNGAEWLHSVREAGAMRGRRLWALPVLESADLADPLRRPGWLQSTKDVLDRHRDVVLSLRIGAADILGSLGLRRRRDLTSFHYGPLRDAMTAISGALAGDASHPMAISGCVWEHYPSAARRGSHHAVRAPKRGSSDTSTSDWIRIGFGALAEELDLDRANGLVGKSAIHPSQVLLMNAWHAVSHEDYVDAGCVLGRSGASSSPYRNKMNESEPHRRWAIRVQQQAKVFGVLEPFRTHRDLADALTYAQRLSDSSAVAVLEEAGPLDV